MDIHTATEQAYKKGYEDGKRDAVKHGRWKQMKAYKSQFVCSECGDLFPDWESDYCPNCGARMDGTGDV